MTDLALKDQSAQNVATANRAAWIEIDLSAIRENVTKIRSSLGPAGRVLAVVKADAYGHGIVPVGHALAAQVDYFGVGSFEEGVALREAGITTSVLVFSPLLPRPPSHLAGHDLTFVVSADWQIPALRSIAEVSKRKVAVHVKIDTGMGRLGVRERDALSLIEDILREPALVLEGLLTHFPDSEAQEAPFARDQLARFRALVETLKSRGIEVPYLHAANSSGILNVPGASLTLARPGLMLYGVMPHRDLRKRLALHPALSLYSRISFLKSVRKGDSVSYGRTYRAAHDTRIAVVPIGYAHGYPFTASGRAEVLVGGKRLSVAGRVCMDSLMVDLGPGTMGCLDDRVTLIGRDENEAISVETLAEWSHTIPYEILTRLHPSLPRFYRESAAQ